MQAKLRRAVIANGLCCVHPTLCSLALNLRLSTSSQSNARVRLRFGGILLNHAMHGKEYNPTNRLV